MTTTDQFATDPIDDMLAGLGEKSLRAFLAEPDDLAPDVAQPYANFAVVAWHPDTRATRGEGGVADPQVLVDLVGGWLIAALAGDFEQDPDDPEVVWVEAHGQRMPVTAGRVRHWEWIVRLLTLDQLAARFLELIPAEVRANATAVADNPDRRAFAEIVANFGETAD